MTEDKGSRWNNCIAVINSKHALGPADQQFISISRAGDVSFSCKLLRNNKVLFEHKYISAFYCEDEGAFFFEFTDDYNTGIKKLTKARGQAKITMQCFMKNYGFKLEEVNGRYKPLFEYIPGRGERLVLRLDHRLNKETT